MRVPSVDPSTLDPGLCWDFSARVVEELFVGLVSLTPEGSVVPNLARRWEIQEGGRQYVFHLRDDVCWSDGVPVTAGDVEYAWKRLLDPATGAGTAELLYDIRGARAFHQREADDPSEVAVRARDDVTLEVQLEAPTGYFLYLLTFKVTFPVPQHVVRAQGQRLD